MEFIFITSFCFMATTILCLIAKLTIKFFRIKIKSSLYYLTGLTFIGSCSVLTVTVNYFMRSKFPDSDTSIYAYIFCTVLAIAVALQSLSHLGWL